MQPFRWILIFLLMHSVGSVAAEPLMTAEGPIKTTAGIEFADGSTQATAASGDNLGDHVATQDLNMDSNLITNVADPALPQDMATKAFVDLTVTPVEQTIDGVCALALDLGKCELFPVCSGRCPKTVFVTSTTQAGNLGGITGADAICQGLADAAALDGTYFAWLANAGDSETAPLGRFTQADDPYVLVDGTQIAADWTDLTDGTLDAGIDRDEAGLPQTGTVWSAAKPDGDFRTTVLGYTCNDWNSTSDEGQQGTIGETAGAWSFNGSRQPCDTEARLYCFQQ